MSKTMFEKIWDAHVVHEAPGESTILYIDRHLVHEVTSPQAFAGLLSTGRTVRRPDATIAVLDHNIDRKSTRLNSSHGYISYAVFCLKKKKNHTLRLRASLSLRYVTIWMKAQRGPQQS